MKKISYQLIEKVSNTEMYYSAYSYNGGIILSLTVQTHR